MTCIGQTLHIFYSRTKMFNYECVTGFCINYAYSQWLQSLLGLSGSRIHRLRQRCVSKPSAEHEPHAEHARGWLYHCAGGGTGTREDTTSAQWGQRDGGKEEEGGHRRKRQKGSITLQALWAFHHERALAGKVSNTRLRVQIIGYSIVGHSPNLEISKSRIALKILLALHIL